MLKRHSRPLSSTVTAGYVCPSCRLQLSRPSKRASSTEGASSSASSPKTQPTRLVRRCLNRRSLEKRTESLDTRQHHVQQRGHIEPRRPKERQPPPGWQWAPRLYALPVVQAPTKSQAPGDLREPASTIRWVKSERHSDPSSSRTYPGTHGPGSRSTSTISPSRHQQMVSPPIRYSTISPPIRYGTVSPPIRYNTTLPPIRYRTSRRIALNESTQGPRHFLRTLRASAITRSDSTAETQPEQEKQPAIEINEYFKRLEKDGPASSSPAGSRPAQDVSRHTEKKVLGRAQEMHMVDSPWAGDSTSKSSLKGIRKITAAKLELKPITNISQPPVPRLHHGLDRVLFNPGVYQLQDPRTRVFNFDPYLHKILPVDQFNFKALQEYETSSKDTRLGQIAAERKMRYYGSTSSMTGMLKHYHFLLSQLRPLNFSMLTQAFEVKNKQYSQIARVPAAVFLRYKGDGSASRYAIDADKSFDGANVMSLLGHSLEKLLTASVSEFEQYKLDSERSARTPPEAPRNSYNYTTMSNMLMRSQLDAYDPRLPGTGVFDVKTRAVVSVRAHAFKDHQPGLGYEIKQEFGQWESFEREQYDMLRATMLSYSLQARMGRMDGIFAAYHNIERIFGFQYFGLEDLDLGLHGQRDRTLGDQEFKISLALLKMAFDKATQKFPKQSLRMHFEARMSTTVLYIFAEPMTEEEIETIQTRNDENNAKITRTLLGTDTDEDIELGKKDADDWAELRAKVEADISQDPAQNGKSLTKISEETEEPEEEEQLSLEHKLLRLQVSAEKLKASVQQAAGKTEEVGKARRARKDPGAATPSTKPLREAVAGLLRLEREASVLESQIQAEQGKESKLLHFIEHINGLLDDQMVELADLDSTLIPRHQRIAANMRLVAREQTQRRVVEAPDASAEETSHPEAVNDDSNGLSNGTQDEVGIEKLDDLPEIDPDKPLLAFTLTIRNKVNQEPVKRPENLTADDVWTVEYLYDTIADGRQAWTLYEACKKRRKAQLDKDGEAARGLRVFQEEVAKWAAKGKEWRAKQDDEESEKTIRVFEPYDRRETSPRTDL